LQVWGRYLEVEGFGLDFAGLGEGIYQESDQNNIYEQLTLAEMDMKVLLRYSNELF